MADPVDHRLAEAARLQSGGGVDAAAACAQTDVARMFTTAVTLQLQGRVDDAAALYRAILRRDPAHADALHNLGVQRLRAGNPAEAVPLLREALRLRPDLAEGHYNLGLALQRLDDHAGAVEAFRQAIERRPDHAEANNSAAISLLALGRTADAMASLQQAIAARPDYADAYANLGNLFLAAQQPAEAAAQYRKALACQPDDVEANNSLGLALQALDRHAEARRQFERVLALDPAHPTAHCSLGVALQADNRYPQAIASFERALALRPDYAEAWSKLGIALSETGRLEDARDAFARAVALAPRTPRYYRHLSGTRRFAPDDPHLSAMQALADDAAAIGVDGQIDLHFALGKAYADLGRHADSFRHLLAGNALQRRQIAYDEAAHLAAFDRIRTICSPALMRARRGGGDPSPVPVFIVGMPRSGSTLVEQILASHPLVFGAGELPAFEMAIAEASGPGGSPRKFLDALPSAPDDVLRRAGAAYVAAIGAVAPGAARVTDKMLPNAMWLGPIHLALPHARIIHVRRDPVDTCLSCFATLFAGRLPYAYDLGELGRHYRAYAALMAHWRQVLPPGVMLEVDYEDVVADLAGAARRIVAHCGLDWHPACLDFHRTDRPVRTASAAAVRQPLYRGAVGRWRAYGPMLRPLLDALGMIPSEASPGDVALMLDAALALQAQGDHVAAIAAFQQASACQPDHAEASHGAAISLLALGRTEEAIASLERAVAVRPDYAEAHRNLANLLLATQRPGEAIAQYRLALACRPDDLESHNNLGVAFYVLHRHAEAIARFEHALALDPAHPTAHCSLGMALQALGRHAQAITSFERALAVRSDNAEVWNNLGSALREAGRLDDARRAFAQAVAIAPRTPQYYRHLGECMRFAPGDAHLSAMEALAGDPAALGVTDRIELHFALGKAYADLGRHADSFHHLAVGNALKRQQIIYDEAAALAMPDRIRQTYSPAVMRARSGRGDPSRLPIFVVGMPRSGSTLIEQILASHPQVFGAGELPTLEAVLAQGSGQGGDPGKLLALLPDASDAALRRLGAAYVAAVSALAPGATRVTDKMPANYLFVGAIHLVLPNARIIHTRRDPVDTCLSCFSRLFAGNLPYAYDLGEVGRYHRAYARLMAHWRQVLPPGVMLEADYEDVVADLELAARRIVAHCGLDWHPGCLDFHLTDRPVRSGSATEVRQPLYRDAVGRWRAYAPTLRPLLDALGMT